jgi:class 3 adenylate cyclase
MDIVVWLRSLGLGKYEAAFRENEIDETVLPNLTAEDLKELGVSALGHRRKLLDAIAALRGDTSAQGPSSDLKTAPAAPSASPEDRAERRQVTVMFSDLVASTALSALWTRKNREVISAYQKCVADTIQRFGVMRAAHQLGRDFVGCDLAYDSSQTHLHGEMNEYAGAGNRRASSRGKDGLRTRRSSCHKPLQARWRSCHRFVRTVAVPPRLAPLSVRLRRKRRTVQR